MEIDSLLNRRPNWNTNVRQSTKNPDTPTSTSGAPSPRRGVSTPRTQTPLRREGSPKTDQIQERAFEAGKHKAILSPSSPMASSPIRSTRAFDKDASLVLVGIRGCGKRSLGFIAATALNRRFVTEDHYFKEVTGFSRQDFLRIHGDQEFHKRDVVISRKMLDDNKTKCVIECGLGSLTSSVQEHLREYSLTNPVVYLVRDMERIHELLKLGDHSARLLENGDPTHRRCSNFEFYNLEDLSTERSHVEEGSPDRRSPSYSFKLKDAKEDFTYFVRLITGANTYRSSYDSPFSLLEMPTELRLYTHATMIRSSELVDGLVDVEELESGGDAVELCVDRWSPDMVKMISKYVAIIRRKTGVPIIFSAELGSPGSVSGSTSSSGTPEAYLNVLEHGLRLGVEFLSIDLGCDDTLMRSLIANKGMTRIIGHFIDRSPKAGAWDDDDCLSRYNKAEKLGCDIVRLLQVATSRDDNEGVRRFTEKVKALPGSHPRLIAFNVGNLGRTSQVFNTILTSVTHPAIKRSNILEHDPKITSKDAVQVLFQSFVLDPLHFYILGASVSYSLSPGMHNAACQVIGMSHDYKTLDISSLVELDRLAQDPHFGGAAIAQPFKAAIVGQLASKSRHAEAIGAVNTLLPLRSQPDGSPFSLQDQANQRNRAGRVAAWYGDNTDWIGIMVCLNRNLSPRNVIKPLKTTGLVIGAGGMARAAIYSMLRLGCRKIFIYNRTVENAEKVARHFNSWASSPTDTGSVVSVLRSDRDPWPEACASPTMIVSCVPAQSIGGKPAANFEMPTQWLKSPSGGVVIELAYKPLNTPLLKQIRRIRMETGQAWVTVDGLETLPEQGIAQFELMTGRKAPRGRMRLEVLRNYQGEEGQYDENSIRARLESIH